MVCNYDMAIRDLQAKLMKGGHDFKSALEKAMADSDTRILYFTTPFSMEANSAACQVLSAPGLSEKCGIGGPAKRTGLSEEKPPALEMSPGALKRAKKA